MGSELGHRDTHARLTLVSPLPLAARPGLSVSRALRRTMGGDREVAPGAPDRSACFVVTLPAKRAEEI